MEAHGADRLEGPDKAVPTGAFSSQGLLQPTPSSLAPPSTSTLCQEIRAPFSAELAGQQRLHGSRSKAGGGGSRLTFHAHAVIETFVVEAAVVGCAEMFPEVTACSWQHSKHMRSAKLSGSSPPTALQSPTGQEIHHMCGRPCPSGPSGVQGSGLELLLDVMDEDPRGRWQRLEPPQMGHLIDHGRIKGGMGFTSQGWGCNS